MFPNLKSTILKLNADVSDLANQQKAKQLRSKLIKSGGICLGIGLAGVLACFVAFAIIAFNSVRQANGFPILIFVPFVVIFLFAILAGVGSILLRLGLSILIVGATTKFVDKSINNRCECGYAFKKNEKFCPKCGRPAKKICPKCKTENDLTNEYCQNCGEKL